MITVPSISVVIPTHNRPDDLRALLISLQSSTIQPDEIIVVDDYQQIDTLADLRAVFPNVTFHRLEQKGFITGARNAGWKQSHGDYVFFVDDDNETAEDCLERCLQAMDKYPKAGVIGAKTMYYDEPDRIMLVGSRLKRVSALTEQIGQNELDGPEYNQVIEVDVAPNAFLVRREVLEKTGGFDERIVQTWSEADFNVSVREHGYDVLVAGQAKVYHRSPRVDLKRMTPRYVGERPFRMYYLTRNRYVYITRYAPLWEKLIFTLVFSNVFIVYYTMHMVRAGRWDLVKALLQGVVDGLWYMLSGRFTERNFSH